MVVTRLVEFAALATIMGALAVRYVISVDAMPDRGMPTVHASVSGNSGPRRVVTGTAATLVVDGNKTPEVISDLLAYRLFMPTTLVPEQPSAMDLERQALRLARIGFERSDLEAYVRVMKLARRGLDDIAAHKALWSAPAAAQTIAGRAALKK